MIKKLFFILLVGIPLWGYSQDMEQVKKNIKTLCSPKFHGRGYVKKGQQKTALFIAKKFNSFKLQSFSPNYLQTFSISINTFPSSMKVKTNSKKLVGGVDYLVVPSSLSIKGKYNLLWMTGKERFNNLLKIEENPSILKKSLLVIDEKTIINSDYLVKARGLVILKDKELTWSAQPATSINKSFLLEVKRSALQPELDKEITINVKSKYIPNYPLDNVVAWVKGKSKSNKFLIIGAHYDHLGQMGRKIYFPGAHDNASGVAMLLSLAEYFSKKEHKPEYSIIFVAFAAEEAGLFGSEYFVSNLPVEKQEIPLMINLDLLASGSDGITMIGGIEQNKIFQNFETINRKNNLLKKIVPMKNKCNSDQCPFTKAGISAIYLYTRGNEYREYHNINDKAKDIPLTAFSGIYQLLINYLKDPDL
ncbi:MAG: M28 family metallopeptidase [Bacteroidales bacterium]